MGIRARLFTGTTALVLALVAVQWWLQSRQLAGIQRELAVVAGSVGEGLVLHEVAGDSVARTLAGVAEAAVGPTTRGRALDEAFAAAPHRSPSGAEEEVTTDTHVVVEQVGQNEMRWVTVSNSPDPQATPGPVVFFHKVLVSDEGAAGDSAGTWHVSADKLRYNMVIRGDTATILTSDTANPAKPAPGLVELKVVSEDSPRRNVLIVNDEKGGVRRVEIPTERVDGLVRTTLRKGVLASAGLLLVGILGAAVVSHRLTQPVRSLSQGVEAIGHGGFGTQIEVTGKGELGELQQRFNTMSQRLADLEREKQEWAAREHLAELGALARGLGHTVRNPLNTLGLVVEELATRVSDDDRLVGTARAQIRRIDRWLLSFLALGAGRAARHEILDVNELVGGIVLEASQAGAAVSLSRAPGPVTVRAVSEALRAAISNLVDNAVEASPEGAPVEIAVETVENSALITVRDHGPGVPDEVRRQLFTPHVTTKSGGSGMGLFLARQLVEAGHGGSLELLDADNGGTVARVRLPLGGESRSGEVV